MSNDLEHTVVCPPPSAQLIRNWAIAIGRGAPLGVQDKQETLYIGQIRRYIRDMGPPPRRNGEAQAAWSDVCAALYC